MSGGRFRAIRRTRPVVGGVLVALAGVEMFFSTQLDLGKLHVQMGIEGFQATVIPIALVVLGVLAMAMPVHRIFYGVISLALSIYSIVGVNLGGFLIGMLLSAVGGILVVSWAPKDAATAASESAPDDDMSPVTSTRHDDQLVHAEFAPYSSLVASTRAG
jgi:hypothetical protein